MFSVLIAVGSYAFQVSGAVILLLWSLKNCDKKIEQMSLDNDPTIGYFDKTGTYDIIPKEKLQENAKALYKNVAAFLDLVIGYSLAIFMTDVDTKATKLFLYVVIAVVVILFIENCIIDKKAIKRFSDNKRYYYHRNE